MVTDHSQVPISRFSAESVSNTSIGNQLIQEQFTWLDT